jgi:pimeloyl-ACP methyl ester carboxylesterase
VSYVEKWRARVKLTNFYLIGHSFGGYIAGNYALKHHAHIKKLLLLSPVGI